MDKGVVTLNNPMQEAGAMAVEDRSLPAEEVLLEQQEEQDHASIFVP